MDHLTGPAGKVQGRPSQTALFAFCVPLLIVLVSVFGWSCGEDPDEQASTSTSPSASTTSSAGGSATTASTTAPTSSPSTSTSGGATSSTKTSLLSSSEEDLGNGRVRAGGFIKRAYEEGGERRLDIDYADFLTGEEAVAAAAALGEEVNNDYFIRNQSDQLRTFVVTATSFELPQGDPSAPVRGDWGQFTTFLAEFPGTYWWIERQGNEVVLLEGQWVP
jgi:hypothetical protein